MRNLLIVLVSAVFLAGCGGAVYEPKSWSPPQNLNKVTSDWDVASTICDARAGDRELTPEEQEMVNRKKQTLTKTGSTAQSVMEGLGVSGGEYVGAAAGFISGLFGRKSSKEKEEFTTCMEEYGWKQQ